MTNQEFQKELEKYKIYLRPELYNVLVTCVPVFSDEAKKDIVKSFKEAESEMKELAKYQKKRISIIERGIKKLNSIYQDLSFL